MDKYRAHEAALPRATSDFEQTVHEVSLRIGYSTGFVAPVERFVEMTRAGHASPTTFDLNAIREEILYRLAVDLVVGSRHRSAESTIQGAEECDAGSWDDSAMEAAEHLGRITHWGGTLQDSRLLFRMEGGLEGSFTASTTSSVYFDDSDYHRAHRANEDAARERHEQSEASEAESRRSGQVTF